MKNIIRTFALFSLLAVFAVVSVNAEAGFGTEVEIPFAFNVGDKAYEAGSYIVKIERLKNGGGATLSIQDPKSNDIQTVLMNANGEQAGSEVRLVFDTIEGRRYLTKVRANDRSFALVRPKTNQVETSEVSGGANLY